MENRADVLLGLRVAKVALFTADLDPCLALTETAVGEYADNLLLTCLLDQAGSSLPLRFVHLQRHCIATRDCAQRLNATCGSRLQTEKLVPSSLPVGCLPRSRRTCDFGLRLSFNAGFTRLPLQR